MKKALLTALLICSPMLAGCATKSAAEARRAEAWSRCRTSPNPEVRDRCIATEIALMEAQEQRDAASRDAYEKEQEDRQAVLEAHGVPKDKAEKTVDAVPSAPN